MASIEELKLMANKLRVHSIRETSKAYSGHPSSCMSCAEIMSTLFFSEFKDNDEFILSKGHAAPILWAVYAEAGIIKESELKHLRDIHSVLEGHPTKRMPCTKIATGNGVYHSQIKLTFPQEGILQLHRLICQIRNNPFVTIENEFISNSLNKSFYLAKDSLVNFVITGMQISNHQSSPNAFVCELDARLFNPIPYEDRTSSVSN